MRPRNRMPHPIFNPYIMGGCALFWVLVILGVMALFGRAAAADVLPVEKVSPADGAVLAAEIQRRDLDCPQAKWRVHKGRTGHGTRWVVYCGPEGRPGVFRGQEFDAYYVDGRLNLVIPSIDADPLM